MSECDLAIGASGATTWERCCLGLPTVQIIIAENQKQVAEQIRRKNAGEICDKKEIHSKLLNLVLDFTDANKLRDFSINAASLVDGLGSERVVNEVLTECINQ